MSNTIPADHDDDVYRDVDVVIVGAGFAGVGMGIQLARSGRDSFVILERAEDVGGSWRDNVYPGVACDVPSPLYSYSFIPNPSWSRMYAPGGEIWDYIRSSAVDNGLAPHLRFGADMLSARWAEGESRWIVETTRGIFRGKYLIAATGHLTDPKLPHVPGLSDFEGDIFHSARWDSSAELRGKRVGVVGTGASAIQVIPELAALVSQLVVFQRSAPYVVPRNDVVFTEADQRTFARHPHTGRALRDRIFWDSDREFAARSLVPAYVDEARDRALTHLQTQVPDEDLRSILTPDYEIGCKRILVSDAYYPAVQLPNVVVEPHALERLDTRNAYSVGGGSFELDAIVFATGFDTWDLPSSHRVFGRDGQSLGDQWITGMQAYNSTTVHNFPNLFMLNGPATSLGHNSFVYMIEVQLDYVMGALDWMSENGVDAIEVERAAEDAYASALHEQAKKTTWLAGGCTSWYVDPRNGRLTLTWPNFAHRYRDECAVFDPAPYVVHQFLSTN